MLAQLAKLVEGKKPAFLGIDISSSAVKLVELIKSGDYIRLQFYIIEPLPANAVVENEIKDLEAVGSAIARIIKRSRVKNKLTALAMPGSVVITKTIKMDADLSEHDMESQIEVDADQYIPYPLDEVSLDFSVMQTHLGPGQKGSQVPVLLVASRKENVDLRVDAVEFAGLNAKIIEVEAYAIARVFAMFPHLTQWEGVEQLVALVDIGATLMTLHIMRISKPGEAIIIFTREEPVGGGHLTEEIQKRFGLSFEDAEIAKRKGSDSLPDDYRSDLLKRFNEAMAQQLERALEFYYAASQRKRVDRIMLAGGGAALDGLREAVERQTGKVTQTVDPFKGMQFSPKINKNDLNNDAPALLVSAGLALKAYE